MTSCGRVKTKKRKKDTNIFLHRTWHIITPQNRTRHITTVLLITYMAHYFIFLVGSKGRSRSKKGKTKETVVIYFFFFPWRPSLDACVLLLDPLRSLPFSLVRCRPLSPSSRLRLGRESTFGELVLTRSVGGTYGETDEARSAVADGEYAIRSFSWIVIPSNSPASFSGPPTPATSGVGGGESMVASFPSDDTGGERKRSSSRLSNRLLARTGLCGSVAFDPSGFSLEVGDGLTSFPPDTPGEAGRGSDGLLFRPTGRSGRVRWR